MKVCYLETEKSVGKNYFMILLRWKKVFSRPIFKKDILSAKKMWKHCLI